MKRSIVLASLASCALAFSLAASAQTPGQKPDTSKPAPPAGQAKEHTMTGCLQKGTEAGTFVLQNTAGKGPKMVGIVESKDKLDAHVGHKVDITGTEATAKEVDSMKGKVSKADHYMKVSAVKMVSATCP